MIDPIGDDLRDYPREKQSLFSYVAKGQHATSKKITLRKLIGVQSILGDAIMVGQVGLRLRTTRAGKFLRRCARTPRT